MHTGHIFLCSIAQVVCNSASYSIPSAVECKLSCMLRCSALRWGRRPQDAFCPTGRHTRCLLGTLYLSLCWGVVRVCLGLMGAYAGTPQGPRRARLGLQALVAGWRGSAAGSAEELHSSRWGRAWRACSAEDGQARTLDCLLCLSAWG